MTNAATGNNMIPSNPGVVQQQVRDGAQQVAPMHSGVAPRSDMAQQPQQPQQQQPPQAPSVQSQDFWSGIEQAIEPQQENYEGLYEQPSPAPQGQPQVQPDGQGQPQQPQQQPAQQPSAEPQLTPEQQYAIWEASSQGAPQGAPQAPQPQQQQPAPAQDMSALETQAIERLAASEYALPADQAQQMVSEPEKVYPQLAARLHVRLASQIGTAVQQMLPQIVDNMVQQRMAAVELENQFYRSYPQLSDPRFKPVVAASLRAVRQANPQATREQVMSDGAAFAAMKLRLNFQQAQGQVQQPQMQAPRPQPNGQQPQQQYYQVPTQPQQQYQQPVAPFQPAVGGGVGLPTNPQEANEFELLANDPNW